LLFIEVVDPRLRYTIRRVIDVAHANSYVINSFKDERQNLQELLRSIKVERVVLNELALDMNRKWNCAFGDF